MGDVVNSVTTQYLVSGLDTTLANLERVAQAEQRLAAQSSGLSTATAGLDRSTLSAQRSLDAFARGFDPAAKALSNYERFLTLANKATAQGVPLTDAHTRGLAASKARWEEASKAANDNAHAHTANGSAVKLNSMQLAEFGHIGRAAFDELGAGMSPLRVLQTEGARLVQALGEGSGGVWGSIKGIGSAALGFVNPLTVGAVALVGFGAAAYLAVAHTRDLREEMDKAVTGVGRLSGLSGTGLTSLADRGAYNGLNAGTSLSFGDGRSAAATFAASGRLDAGNISGATGLIRGYAGAFGTSYGEAGTALSDIFADPVKGAETLNAKLGFLDDKTRSYITTLRDQGDQQGAIRALIDASSTSMNEHAQKLGVLGQLWRNVGEDAAHFRDVLGQALAAPTDMGAYDRASRSASARVGQGRGTLGLTRDDGTSNLAESLRFNSRLGSAQQNTLVADRQSIEGGDIVRSTLPDIERFQKLVDQQKKLSDAINNPDALSRMGVTADQAHDALDRLNVGLATFRTSAQQIADTSAQQIAIINARTFAEKQTAEYQKAYADTLARTHSVLEAAATAEARRNEAIATATRSAVDSALPGLGAQTKLADDIGLLRDALGRPGASGDVRQAYGNDVVKQGFSDPAQRRQQDYELSMASIDAFSTAEKAAVEARRAELQVLRETGDLTRAQAAAQMAVNEAVSKANSDADDRLGAARQEAGYVGMTSYQRSRQQLIDSFSGYGGQFSKDAASGADLSEAMKPVASDLKSAGDLLAQAIRDVAQKAIAAASPFGTLAGVSFGQGAALPTFAGGAGRATPEMIADAAARTGMPAAIIAAIGQVENSGRLSGGTTMLGSDGRPSSAWGFGQLTNGAAAEVQKVVPGFSKYNPDTAVFGSAEYLKILADRNGGSLTAALNAYGGTSGYATKVLGRAGGANDNIAPVASTALPVDRSVLATRVNTLDRTAQQDPIDAANRALDNQNRLLDIQDSALGKTKAQIAGAAAAQNLLNHYLTEHIDISPAMEASIKAIGDRTAETTQRTEDFQKRQQEIISTMDSFRGGFGDGLKSFVTDLEHGKSAGTAFRDVMEQIGQKLQSAGLDALTGSLFGKQGQSGGGLFGGALGGLFGGGGLGSIFSGLFGGSGGSGGIGHNAAGTDDWRGGPTVVGEKGPEIVNLPQHAQVVPNNAAFGRPAPNVNIAGHTIVIQGSADDKTITQMRQELAASEARQQQFVVRNLQTISATNQQYAA